MVLMLQQNQDPSASHSHEGDSNAGDHYQMTEQVQRADAAPDSAGDRVDLYWNQRLVQGRILGKLAGDKTRYVHPFSDQPVVVVGSGAECDWSFPGSGLAEQQACFLFFDRRIYCVDLTGSYALQVRGGRFQQIWVHDGSIIEIGPLRLRLQIERPVLDDATIPLVEFNAAEETSNVETVGHAGRHDAICTRRLELRKKGSATPWHYELKREVTLIGREAPSTIRLKDPSLAIISTAIVQTEMGVWQVVVQRSGLNRQTTSAVRCLSWNSANPLQLGIFQLFLRDELSKPDHLLPSLAGQHLDR